MPLYKPVFGADQADPTRVTHTTGLPTKGQRTSGSPASTKVTNATASVTTTGNSVAVGGTGGTAVPGIFVFTADPDNSSVIVLGDTNISAAAKVGSTAYVRELPLQPGASYVIDTNDLRSWKMAVRTANDGGTYIQVG